MRVKSRYSLNLEELGVPAPDLMPVVLESGISLPQVQESFSESLNVFKAFANYLVERNRTRDMARQFAAARRALDARNYEAERQSEIIVANYAEQLKHFLAEQEVTAGEICAVTGLENSEAGDAFGAEKVGLSGILEPVLSYSILPPDGMTAKEVFLKIRELAYEAPELGLSWREQTV